MPAYARAHRSEDWANKQFANAERAREALNGRPAEQRTRREYQSVLNAYRSVYFGAPASSKADPSVVAVAELMVEMGHRFQDEHVLRSAVKQYEFLRREYPGSKRRFEALFTIAEIYQDDLKDPEKARATFTEFVRRYPRHSLAADARAALAQPMQQAAEKTPEKSTEKNPAKVPDKVIADKGTDKGGDKVKVASDTRAAADPAEQANTAEKITEAPAEKAAAIPPADSAEPARVTSIRHWSTPDYTRIAIDVEQDVKFESQRIGEPERIYFDLLNTKLASTLVGKTFDVDDGFLKKIRVAQFQPGRTRVVLEVDELSDYNAFLLPNPSRLIIDVRSKATAARKSAPETAAKAETPAETRKDAAPKRITDGAKPQSEQATTKESAPKLHVPAKEPAKKEEAAAAKSETAEPVVAEKVPVKVVAGKNGVPKTIVDADEDDASEAKLETPETPKPEPTPARRSASKGRAAKSRTPQLEIHEAQPTANGDRSLIRALGLKIGKIVIDAGHGGHDTGTIGPNGLREKDLVLDVAKRLGKLLESRLGEEVIYTRNDDTFIPLETRTAIANQAEADLFVSIHANSSNDPDARGVETYYLNFTSASDALEVAARENAVSDKSIHELQDLVKKIALKEKIEESREFASDVQQALHTGLSSKSPGLRNRGVKKAPFIVLIGANMPSILAEISFVSNPGDERRLRTPEYRQRIAESLYRGISKYVSGLSGVKVASKIEKTADQ